MEAEKEVLEGSGEVPFGIGSRLFFIGTLIILALLTLALFFPFLNVILAVVVLVVILKPLYGYILARNWIRGRQRLAATLTLIALVVLGIIPIALLLYLTLTQLIELLQNLAELDLESFLSDLSASISNTPLLENIELNPSDIGTLVQNLALAAAEWLTNLTLDFVTSLPVLFMQAIVFLILFLTLLPEFDSLVERIEKLSPLGEEISKLYYRKFTAMTTSMVTGIFLIAIIQGVVMGFFFWLAGVPITFLMTILSILFAMLPVVGISYLSLITAFVFVLMGNYTSALIVLFGFYGVVNWIDVVLRPRLVSKEAYMNFALVFLGIFGGLYLGGILGLIYGPVIVLLLVTTINVYAENFAHHDTKALQTFINERTNDNSSI